MVYKKYILKNGKLHGPYYYESYREGNAVKKRYLGSSAHSIPSLDRSFIIPLVLIALASMLLIFFSYKSITGYSVGDANSEVPASSPDIQDTTENTEISTESPSLIENVPFVEISPGPSSDSRENTEIPEDNSQESGLIIENGEEETLNDSQEDSNISDNLNESLLQEQNNVSEETNETIAPRIPDTNFSTENNSSINNTLIIPPENITEEDNKTIQIPSEIIENNNISNQTNYAEMLNFTETNETLKNITNSTPNIVNIHSLELLKDFPTLRIPRNGELLINLSEYFKGAESYEILIPNIVPFIEGDTLSLKAEQGFSGAKKGSIIANAGNESLESNQFTILVSGGAVTITTKREKIKAGEPVRWTKNISLDNPENITLELPAGAENISVKKLSEDFQTSLITANVISDGSAGYSVWLKLKSLLGKIFSSFTGRAIQYEVAIVQDKNDVSNQTSIQVILNASASDYIIEYYTDGPEIHESEISSGKQVTISAPDEFNYTDIIAYSNVSSILGFSELKTLKIYWYNYESGNIFVNISKRVEDLEDNTLIEFVGDEISEDSENTSLITSDSSYENSTLSIESNLFSDYNDSLLTGAVISSDEIISESNQSEVNYLLQEIPYDAYDLDEDGYIDYVEWVVPHLSNQTYQLVTSNRDFAVSSNITLEDQFSHLSINVANAPYNSLIGYLPFDADNVSMGHDYSSSRNDFTYSNGAVPTDNCIYESCVQLDGVNDAVIAPTGVYNFSINDSFTLMAWIYPFVKGNENAERGIMGRYTGAVGSGYYYFTIDGTDGGGATDKLEFRMSGNNNTVLINQNANTTIANERWTHVAVTFNGSQVILYKDGAIESGGNIATNAVNINSSAVFQIGSAGSSAFVFNGTIDEAIIFNRAFDSLEISAIYNASTAQYNHNFTQLSSGSTYTYRAHTLDTAGNINESELRSTGIDTTLPVVIFGERTDNNSSNASRTWIYANVSVIETNEANITFSLSNSSGNVNTTTLSAGNRIFNWTGLGNGTYMYNVSVTDLAGNLNVSETRTITLDTGLPNGTLISPANNTYSSNTSQNFTANFSDSSGLKNASLYIYNSTGLFTTIGAALNGLTASIGNLVESLVDGIYTWFYRVFDRGENVYTSGNFTIKIDTINPQISFIDPTPSNASGATQQVVFNVSINDTNLANVTYNWNGTISIYNTSASELFNSGNGLWIFTVTQSNLSIGSNYVFNISAKDLANNINATETRTIVANSKPSFVSIAHTPNTTLSLDPNIALVITLNVSDSDSNIERAILQWKNSSLSWDNATNVTMSNISTKNITTIFNGSFIPLFESNYSFRIWANDTQGDSNISVETNLSVFLDCTWNITPSDLGAVFGWDQNKFISNITLNNSGDAAYSNTNCSLDFRFTYDLAEGRIFFNHDSVKPSTSITLAAGNSTNVIVNASFLSEVKQDSAIITVNEFRARSDTSSRNASLT